MKEYMVYFEIYGKKMKTKVIARSKVEADEIVRKNLTIRKIDEVKNDDLHIIDYFNKNIFK